MTVDVIIPVYKPGKELLCLLERLERQTVQVRKILMMNTEACYFEQFTAGLGFKTAHDFERAHEKVEVHHLTKPEFDHGGTRRKGVELSEADVFVMMTQDAVPADELLLEHLLGALQQDVACAYARQLPAEDCSEIERFTRAFNYPDRSYVKAKEDLVRMGIKTYFCSNVCAAYRRDVYEKLGGFVQKTIFNEDMIYAAGAVQAGYKVAYAAQARVIHSHNYTCRQQFHRNFDLGVSQAQHPEIFAQVPSESEGKKMVLQTAGHLCRQGKVHLLFVLVCQSAAKYAGYFLGKHYQSLSKAMVLACSDNKAYWQK